MQYNRGGTIAKERRVQNNVASLQCCSSLRSTLGCCRHRLSEYIERLTADITNVFSAILYGLFKKAHNLVKKQRQYIKSTMTPNLEAFDGFLRNIDSKLSRPRPSS